MIGFVIAKNWRPIQYFKYQRFLVFIVRTDLYVHTEDIEIFHQQLAASRASARVLVVKDACVLRRSAHPVALIAEYPTK